MCFLTPISGRAVEEKARALDCQQLSPGGSQANVSLSQASEEATEETHPSLCQRCGEPLPAPEGGRKPPSGGPRGVQYLFTLNELQGVRGGAAKSWM